MDWSTFDKGVYLVNCLGIVYNIKTKKILIGRRENDAYLNELTWCFPGGRPNYSEILEQSLKKQIKTKTGLDVKIRQLLHVRTYPEKKEFLSLYYFCEVTGGKEQAGELFKEIKWIEPSDVEKYFTTSIDPCILEFLHCVKEKY